MESMTTVPEDILKRFDTHGQIDSIKPFGSGHINDSFLVKNADDRFPNYFLQRINHFVFKDVQGMMDNIHAVTEYLANKYQHENTYQTLRIVKARDGSLYTKYDEKYWRLYLFVEGLKSIDAPDSPELIHEGANGFGKFMTDLSGFNAHTLNITIPYFHHMPRRLKRLAEVVAQVSTFTEEEKSEVEFVMAQSEDMCLLQRLQDAGKLPTRVTHNDTKFNNILFDEDNHAKCVIDLDTVMPGLVHFDYGDGIRTSASTCAEDEADLSIVDIDIESFEAFTSGYLEKTKEILTEPERETLLEGALMMTFIMGVRFLTDHLEGNKYYKTAYPNHNLVRARCQLELTRKMLARKPDLVSIVNKYSS